ncbi:MAG: aldo/keto reductase, partial [Sinomicrobium sp.]|nr:aldo/keto reductase [Sinomicrobium sp.]
HISENYTPSVLRSYVEASLKNMGLERLDLIQLHCPPTPVFYRPEIFAEFEKMIAEGKIHKLGVSVEKVEEALKAIEYDHVDTVQIIFNIFRQRPAELFFEQARQKNIGIIVRVPLASGLLTGKYSRATTFLEGDHRAFNRDGAAFDKGETFSGVDYELGLETVDQLKQVFPGEDLAQIAIRWVLMFPEVSCVIPGASRPDQAISNLQAAELPALSDGQMTTVQNIYRENIKKHVHHLW